MTRALDVRRVREQRQDALLAQLAQAREVYHLALDGRDVYLEVAGVDDGAYGHLDGQGHGVRDGVVHVYHLDLKAAELEPVARLLREDLRVVQQVEFPYGERNLRAAQSSMMPAVRLVA